MTAELPLYGLKRITVLLFGFALLRVILCVCNAARMAAARNKTDERTDLWAHIRHFI